MRIAWWRALNPAIYLISLLPALAVVALADGAVNALPLTLATLGVVLLQHAINLFNDVSDWRLGADTEKADSWVRVFEGDTAPVQRHGIISSVLGAILGLAALVSADSLWILIWATPLVLLGYAYNAGKRPLSYTFMGEWVTGICYGPGVFGGLWLVAGGEIGLSLILGSVSFAALSVSLLLSHQPPQIDTDRAAGKHSFAVRHGTRRTIRVSQLLFIISVVTLGVAYPAIHDDLILISYLSMVIVATYFLVTRRTEPRTILMLASAVISFTLAAQSFTGSI